MTNLAKAAFQITSWDESSINEDNGLPKLVRASVTSILSGDIEGESTIEYLMTYRDDGSAAFVGLERVTGSVGDRSGCFVVQQDGVFENGAARANLTIIPNSATGDLAGLRGAGSYIATHEQPTSFTLDYEFE
jgi:hypothetical protein